MDSTTIPLSMQDSYKKSLIAVMGNPYVGKGDPKLRQSVVAYVDILGYKQLVQKAYKNRTGDSLLRKLHRALNDSHEHIDPVWTSFTLIGSLTPPH